MLDFLPGKKTYSLLILGALISVFGGVAGSLDPTSQFALPWADVIQRLYILAIGVTGRKALS